MVKTFLGQVEKDVYHWKWVLVALHNSLQGFMVCALRGKDGINILKDSVVRKWVAAGSKGHPEPQELDTFLNLYKKIKGHKMLINKSSKTFCPRGKQDASVRKLNQLRNNFIHFKSKSWHVEINSLPRITAEVTDIISFLALTSGNIKLKKEEGLAIKQDINDTKSILDRLETIYGR